MPEERNAEQEEGRPPRDEEQNKTEFWDRMKSVLNQGFETTREALDTAAEKARQLGEKGVLRFEIGQLEREAGRKLSLVGSRVYRILVEQEKNTVSKSTPEIKTLLMEIQNLKRRIEAKENELADIG